MADQTIHDETVVTTVASGDELLIWRVANSDTRRITKANFVGAVLSGGGTIATGGFTLTVAGNSSINGTLSGGGTLATGGFTLTMTGDSQINGTLSGAGQVVTGGFTLTVPATGTAALLARSQTFTATQGVAPATNADGFVVNMPVANSTYGYKMQYAGIDYWRFAARSGISALTSAAVDLGVAVAGPFINIGRNSNATTPTPGSLQLFDKNGAVWVLWVDSTGKLRINASTAPTTSDVIGTVVGTQT